MAIVLKTKARKSQKVNIFGVYEAQMHVSLFFDHDFNFLGVNANMKEN